MENSTMKKSMDITINRLPARTWNHLKMNEAMVSDVVIPASDDNVGSKEAVLAGDMTMREFEQIETALGKDMDRITESFPVKVIGSVEGEEKKIVLDVSAEENDGRYFLYLNKNSHMNVAVYCATKENETNPLYLQFKIYAQEKSRLDLTIVQAVDSDSRVFTDIGGVLEEKASANLVKMELGGKEVYSGAYMDLKGDYSAFQANIGYLGTHRQHFDMNYVARHRGKNTTSLMESSGVLREEAFKLFRGTIDFVKGCSGSVGNEKEDVLLLGDDVVNQTIPLILCAEEDVEGNHGASIGELDEKTLFYLMSRGFTAEAAQKMVAKARLEAVAAQITEDSVKEKTLHFLEERQ